MAKLLATVSCDNCKWRLDNQSVPHWLNRPCPDCGSIIITRAEYKYYRWIEFLFHISEFIKHHFPGAKKINMKIHCTDNERNRIRRIDTGN